MALSFLSLPPEVRVQIYRHLLCHDSWIWPGRSSDMEPWLWDIQATTRGMGLLTSFEREPRTKYSPESAILRTCRIIYAEAMHVLYGENMFIYPCCRYVLHSADYPEAGFPEKNLDFMKHLELNVYEEEDIYEEKWNVDSTTTKSIAAAIQYFVRGGCDLRTFKLSLWEDYQLSEGKQHTDRLVDLIFTSSELEASLVALQVSESLTISIWCLPDETHYGGEMGKRARDQYQVFVNRLASEKGMTAIMEVDFPDPDPEEEDDDSENPCLDEVCKMSWCLRP